MKIALITADKFEDYDLLKKELDALGVSDVVAGTKKAYELLKQYVLDKPQIHISIAEKKANKPLQRAYNAIDSADHVLIYTHANGIKTKKAHEYAMKKNKTIYIHEIL